MMRRTFNELEMPLVPVLADLEWNGALSDMEILMIKQLRSGIAFDKRRLYSKLGEVKKKVKVGSKLPLCVDKHSQALANDAQRLAEEKFDLMNAKVGAKPP